MNRKDAPALLVADGVHKISNRENGEDGSEDKFWLVEEIPRNIFVAAVLDVINLQQCEQPQKGARYEH